MTTKWFVRFGWMAVGVAALYVVSALAGAALGGPLDPPGAPSPTMKTLQEIPGTWSRVLGTAGADPCNTARFTCVLAGEAVQDNETGLVWERQPSTTTMAWAAAVRSCGDSLVGGRGGWRVPTDAELRSLLDPAGPGQPILPGGHPFLFAGTFGLVWTVSPVPNETDHVYSVDVDTLDRDPTAKTTAVRNWCVRGVQADAPEDSALAEQPPSWYRTLDATGGCYSERFRCVLNNEAVLDRETGLVWQRTLDAFSEAWATARNRCLDKGLGGRYGWRLATIEEMKTLLHGWPAADRLPTGHPFIDVPNVAPFRYWTATTSPGDATSAYTFGSGSQGGGFSQVPKTDLYRYWCVRGGSGFDGM